MKNVKTLVLALAVFSLTVDAVALNVTPKIKYKDKTYLYCYGTASVNIDGVNYPVTGKKEDRFLPKNFFLSEWAHQNGRKGGDYVSLKVSIPETFYTRNNANVPYLIPDKNYRNLREQCQATLENVAKEKIKKYFKDTSLKPQISNVEIRARDNRWSYDHQLVAVKEENGSTKIDTIVSFGDSLSDTGNTNNYFQWALPSRTSWYAGHFSNGWTWPEYAAKELGVNAHNEAWGAAGASDEFFSDDLLGKSAYAALSSMDSILPISGDMDSTVYENGSKMRLANFTKVPGLYTQSEYFYEKILSRYHLNPNRTLYTILIGGNDFMNYGRGPIHVSREVEKFVRTLINHGAKNIALLNLPDISVAPRFSPDNQIDARNLMQYNVEIYNERLTTLVEELNQEYSSKNVKIKLFDTAELVKDIVTNPAKYKLDNVTDTCLADVLDTTYLSGSKMNEQCNGSNYMFWDNVHPTTYVHEILGKEFTKFAKENYNFAEKNDSQSFSWSPPKICVNINLT